MGAGHSTRKLTITNEEELGVIHISNGVAQRLAQGVSNVETSQMRDSKSQSVTNAVEQTPKSTENVVQPPRHFTQSPVNVQPEYTISALQMQQMKEEELKNQNIYWQRRMQNMKDNHAKIDRLLEEEYQRAVDQVAAAQGKKKVDIDSVVPPCLENKDKVLKCYQENPKEILKCSSLVEEFSNCVDQRRAGLIAARC